MTFDDAIGQLLTRVQATADETSMGFPHYADTATGLWTRTPDGDWTGSFFIGELWLAAAATGERRWTELALSWAPRILPRADSRSVFRGFLFWYGAALGAVLLDDERAKDIALVGAQALASAFWSTAGLIPLGSDAEEAHTVGPTETNIDGVPGTTPLLHWAGTHLARPGLEELAIQHAVRHAELLVRDDDSVVQSATLDPGTGRPLRTYTHKGLRDDSTWARAQAWAMLGFAQASRRSSLLVRPAVRVSDWWIANLPESGVSAWDFDAARTEPEPRVDTSATAIAAAALLKLSNVLATSDEERASTYRAAAHRMVRTLVDRYLTPTGMLTSGCYNHRIGLAVDNELIWGDYFLLEALLVLTDKIEPGMV